MRITKRQLKLIIQEEMTGVIREGWGDVIKRGLYQGDVEDFGKGVGYVTDQVVNAPAKIGRAVKKVGSEFLSGFDSQTDVRVPASDRKAPYYVAAPTDPVATGPADFNDVDIHGELIHNDEMDGSTGENFNDVDIHGELIPDSDYRYGGAGVR